MKCGPDGCPIMGFSDLTPAEQRVQRKRRAKKMKGEGFTLEQIAKQFGVRKSIIGKDLGDFPQIGKLKVVVKTPRNPRGAGRPMGTRKAKKYNGDACDYDWENVQAADFGGFTKAYKAQAEHYRREAMHLADAYPLLSIKIDPSVITDDEIQAARKVAQAWLEVADALARRKQKVALTCA